jgi:Holliday junction resolvasome RuvABC DNA-binding subunit
MEIFKKYIKKEDLENIMKILGNNKKYAEIMLNIPNIKKSFDIYI